MSRGGATFCSSPAIWRSPADQIPKVVEQLDAGNDFVNTLRTDRWGGSHALKSKLANGLLNCISGLSLSDRGSGLKGMSAQLAKSLRLYGEWHRFLPDLASIYTSRIVEFEVPFEERKAGISSYTGQTQERICVLRSCDGRLHHPLAAETLPVPSRPAVRLCRNRHWRSRPDDQHLAARSEDFLRRIAFGPAAISHQHSDLDRRVDDGDVRHAGRALDANLHTDWIIDRSSKYE